MENNEKQNKNKNYIIMSICIVLAVVFGVLLGLVYSNRDVIFKNNKETEVQNNNNNNNKNKYTICNIK